MNHFKKIPRKKAEMYLRKRKKKNRKRSRKKITVETSWGARSLRRRRKSILSFSSIVLVIRKFISISTHPFNPTQKHRTDIRGRLIFPLIRLDSARTRTSILVRVQPPSCNVSTLQISISIVARDPRYWIWRSEPARRNRTIETFFEISETQAIPATASEMHRPLESSAKEEGRVRLTGIFGLPWTQKSSKLQEFLSVSEKY